MKKRKKRRRYSKPLILIALAVFCYILYKFVSLEVTYHKLAAERDKLTDDLNNKKIYYEQLTSALNQAKSDDYIELLAKKYLGLINKDEKIFIIKSSEDTNN